MKKKGQSHYESPSIQVVEIYPESSVMTTSPSTALESLEKEEDLTW